MDKSFKIGLTAFLATVAILTIPSFARAPADDGAVSAEAFSVSAGDAPHVGMLAVR